MRVEKILCDLCGNEVKTGKETALFEFEFCKPCSSKIKKVISGMMKSREEGTKKSEPKPPEVRPIIVPKERASVDWDKACALKLAGWKTKDIAEELHVNEGTLNANIYKHLEAYKRGERVNHDTGRNSFL